MTPGKRYPIRGFFAGLLAGISIAIFLVLSSVIALGTNAIYVPMVVGAILGVLWSLFGPARTRRGAAAPMPAMAGAPGAGEGPPPDTAPAPGEGAPPDTGPAPGEGPPPDTAPAAGEGPVPE